MKRKIFLKVISPAIILCFLLNILLNNTPLVSLLNSTILGLTLLIIIQVGKHYLKLPLLFILSTALIPLLTYSPAHPELYVFVIISIVSWLTAINFPRYAIPASIIGVFVFFWGTLLSNQIFSTPFTPNYERLIWRVPTLNQSIINHQKDALYLPYRLRLLIFNKSVFIYTFFNQIAKLLTLRNLYDTILLANIYSLSRGVSIVYENRNKLTNKIALMVMLFTLTVAGINTSPDKFNSLFMALPFIIYLIVSGFEKINKKVYIALFIISVVLVTSPV